jgi:hypothetical protein
MRTCLSGLVEGARAFLVPPRLRGSCLGRSRQTTCGIRGALLSPHGGAPLWGASL